MTVSCENEPHLNDVYKYSSHLEPLRLSTFNPTQAISFLRLPSGAISLLPDVIQVSSQRLKRHRKSYENANCGWTRGEVKSVGGQTLRVRAKLSVGDKKSSNTSTAPVCSHTHLRSVMINFRILESENLDLNPCQVKWLSNKRVKWLMINQQSYPGK